MRIEFGGNLWKKERKNLKGRTRTFGIKKGRIAISQIKKERKNGTFEIKKRRMGLSGIKKERMETWKSKRKNGNF
jgi:hypothetical protein